jgi:hypothetical protein
MAEEAVVRGLHCRVLRKHAYSRSLLYLDVVFCSNATVEATGGDCTRRTIEFASVALRRVDDDSNLQGNIPIIGGDAVTILHGVIKNYQESVVDKTERMTIVVKPGDIVVSDAWSIDRHGFFSFEYGKVGVPEFRSGIPVAFNPPRLVVQCKQHSVERVLSALHLLCQKLYGERYSSITIKESATCFIKSSDRLLLIMENPTEQHIAQKDLIDAIVVDPVLSPAVMRIYSGTCTEAIASTSHPQLSVAIATLREQMKAVEVVDVRLHVYPKYVAQEILTLAEDWLGERWNPRDASNILHCFLADGIWHLSFMRREDSFIGDLRDKNGMPNFGSKDSASVQYDSICRATGKVREIFARNETPWSKFITSNKKFSFAIDVGASPGGWSSYLAQQLQCEHVIAVDKGQLSLPQPWPASLQHWCLLGKHAIEFLVNMRQESDLTTLEKDTHFPPGLSVDKVLELKDKHIDLYCCDANIEPTISLSFFLEAKSHGLLNPLGTLFIITLKNTYGKKEKWEQGVADCLAMLPECDGFHSVQLQHLLANTAKETTLSGFYIAPSNI